MAIWQFDLYMISLTDISDVSKALLEHGISGLIDTDNTYNVVTKDKLAHFLQDLNGRFDESVHWLPEMKLYGSLEGNCIEVECSNDNLIAPIHIRIDMRDLNYPFLQSLVELAKKYGCCFVTLGSKILRADFILLKKFLYDNIHNNSKIN